ncbi:MAG: hypothetical protein U5N58_00895 [Actinomycetota bacterium]|nr:hypothetical protein [Actinomycetota bacterium]
MNSTVAWMAWKRVIDAVCFKGAAGTGKTMLALESAKRSVAAGNKTLVTCFNKLLAGWLGTQLRLQGFDKGIKAMAFLDYLEEIARDYIPRELKKIVIIIKKIFPSMPWRLWMKPGLINLIR